jgi:hypothetical protein
MIRTRIGEGLSLSVTPGSKPILTLAGLGADEALGFKTGNKVQAKNNLGISTGGWIAIGVGSVALIVGGLYLWGKRLSYCEEEDHHC